MRVPLSCYWQHVIMKKIWNIFNIVPNAVFQFSKNHEPQRLIFMLICGMQCRWNTMTFVLRWVRQIITMFTRHSKHQIYSRRRHKCILLAAQEELREQGVRDEAINDGAWMKPEMSESKNDSENGYPTNTPNFSNILQLDLEDCYHLYHISILFHWYYD